MQAEQIATTLGNAKKVGHGFLASCPVSGHGRGNGDKNPSLSITETDDGNILFKCHGGCDQETVFKTIRDMGLLPELPKTEYLTDIKPIRIPILEQEWVYTDENELPLFVKQRYKTFDDKGKTYKTLRIMADGSRVGKLGDCRIVPYQLPEVIHAIKSKKPVFICEGEKAADAIRSLGAVATTSHAGSGSWNQDLNAYFDNATIIVLPDYDLAGYRYADKIVSSFQATQNCQSIRVVDLGLIHPKDDAYDWVVSHGGSYEKLMALSKATAPMEPNEVLLLPRRMLVNPEMAEKVEPGQVADLSQLSTPTDTYKIESAWEIQDEPVEWLIESVIPKRAFVALFAPPASYKSFIALDIAEAVATGREWCNNSVKKGVVIYIAGEGHGGMGARIKALRQMNNTPDGSDLYVIRAQINLRSSVEDFNRLVLSIQKLIHDLGRPVDLIVLDTLMRMSGAAFNENASEDMGAFITQTGKIQAFFACALMVIHHTGKDVQKGLRGHSSLLGAVDTELEIARQEGITNTSDSAVIGNAIVSVTKQKDGADSIQFGIEIVLMEIGTSDLGFETTTSLAIRHNQEIVGSNAKASKNNAGSGGNQRIEMDSLMKVIKAKGSYREVEGSSRYGVSLDDWREEFWSMKGCTDDDKVAFRKAWMRARERLVGANKIVIGSNWVWLKTVSGF